MRCAQVLEFTYPSGDLHVQDLLWIILLHHGKHVLGPAEYTDPTWGENLL